MQLKKQALLRQSMADYAAMGDRIRVDPDLILPGASKPKLSKVLGLIGGEDGKDFCAREKLNSTGYTLWLTDDAAMRIIPMWRDQINNSNSIVDLWTEEKEAHTLDLVRRYAELYPVTDSSEPDEELIGGDAIALLEAIYQKIEDHGIGLRKSFPQETVRLYAMFLAERRSGRCPISHRVLVDGSGNLLEGAEVDHFYSRSYVGINGGWIIFSDENKKLRDPAYRATINTRFLTFQDELAQWMEASNGAEFDF